MLNAALCFSGSPNELSRACSVQMLTALLSFRARFSRQPLLLRLEPRFQVLLCQHQNAAYPNSRVVTLNQRVSHAARHTRVCGCVTAIIPWRNEECFMQCIYLYNHRLSQGMQSESPPSGHHVLNIAATTTA